MTRPPNPDNSRDPGRPLGEAQGAHDGADRRSTSAFGKRQESGQGVEGATKFRGGQSGPPRGLWAVLAVLAAIIVGLLIWWAVHHFSHGSDDKPGGAASSSESAGAAVPTISGAAGSSAPGVLESPTASAPPAPTVASTSIDTPNGRQVTIADPAIIAEYASKGYSDGYLGKPLGPVVELPDGGRFLTLQGGSIYYNPVAKKAFSVHGAIGGYWGEQGHERSPLGYPNSNEAPISGGVSQSFDNGTLTDRNGTVTEAK